MTYLYVQWASRNMMRSRRCAVVPIWHRSFTSITPCILPYLYHFWRTEVEHRPSNQTQFNRNSFEVCWRVVRMKQETTEINANDKTLAPATLKEVRGINSWEAVKEHTSFSLYRPFHVPTTMTFSWWLLVRSRQSAVEWWCRFPTYCSATSWMSLMAIQVCDILDVFSFA